MRKLTGKTTKDQYFTYATYTEGQDFLVKVVGMGETWWGPFSTNYEAQHFIEATKAKQL